MPVILLVEDEMAVRAVLAETLTHLNYDVRLAATATTVKARPARNLKVSSESATVADNSRPRSANNRQRSNRWRLLNRRFPVVQAVALNLLSRSALRGAAQE
jgi:CheY-like chemotaxis protein